MIDCSEPSFITPQSVHGGRLKASRLAVVATATPATQNAETGKTVAKVASVAVADPPEAQLDAGQTDAGPALSKHHESAIRACLTYIEETIPDEIANVLDTCRNDPGARNYFLHRAQEVPKSDIDDDDRRHCAACVNLTKQGQCLAAKRGEILAAHRYYPVDRIPIDAAKATFRAPMTPTEGWAENAGQIYTPTRPQGASKGWVRSIDCIV